VTAPAYSNQDPRRTGIYPTGAYWGAAGEQIDMLSGNLNFTLPLLKAVGRGGWSAEFHLSYNSQNWQRVGSTDYRLGADVGYGFGWRLMAGSLIPVYADPYTLSHYVFTDSSGAEHRLNINEAGVWRGMTGLHVYYDTGANRLYFNDGSFWVMGCVSGGSEQDAGMRYPTLMQDANGNQVKIVYRPAIGQTTANTSARIQQIEDVRAPAHPAKTFEFQYNTDSPV
jgi:hypothetical protein